MIFKRKDDVATAQIHRRGERNETEWTTHYTLEGVRGHGWRECQIVNVSRDGIGLQLSGATFDQLTACRMVVAVDVPRASLRLRGDVRHLEPIANGCMRVSLEFDALSAFERDMFDELLESSPPTTVRERAQGC